MATSKTDLKDV